jgi:hypothetical protein
MHATRLVLLTLFKLFILMIFDDLYKLCSSSYVILSILPSLLDHSVLTVSSEVQTDDESGIHTKYMRFLRPPLVVTLTGRL